MAGRGMVLTEWKVARPDDSEAAIERKLVQARLQLARYAEGSLAGMELQTVRFVVLVSRDRLCMPDDLLMEHFDVRHINVAIAPRSPSRA